MTGRSRILENYPDDLRCLILRYFTVGSTAQPLPVVRAYSSMEVLDVVTAYTPQKPWWSTPTTRGRVI